MDHRTSISFLYTNIGRGHPFYLDGIVEALMHGYSNVAVTEISDVFRKSSGLSLAAWKAVRWMYRHGSQGGMLGTAYEKLRRGGDYNQPRLSRRILGRNLQRAYGTQSGPLLVAHPILVGILAGRADLVYQHGELVAPESAVVAGARTVLVPIEEAARPFLEAGYEKRQILVTGLCIEPSLADRAEADCRARLDRLASNKPLTGFYVSSGAEPTQHVTKIISSATSAVRLGGRAIVLAKKGGSLERGLMATAARESLPIARYQTGSIDREPALCLLAVHSNRREETGLTGQLFSRVDYLLAPSHERTNWALGLGLPMFALTPAIGPFAPLNLKLLLDSGTTEVIEHDAEANSLGSRVTQLQRSGQLTSMSRNGWGRYKIDGFARIAEFLVSRYGRG